VARGELLTCVRFSDEVGLSPLESTNPQLTAIVVVLITEQQTSNGFQGNHKQLNKCVRIQAVLQMVDIWNRGYINYFPELLITYRVRHIHS
jgi:hypothetical protein